MIVRIAPEVDTTRIRRNVHNDNALQRWQLNNVAVALQLNALVQIAKCLRENLREAQLAKFD